MTSPATVDRAKVDQAMESVCQLGCVTVVEIIREMERGLLPEPAKSLNQAECEYLLQQLREIMSTYT